MPAYEDFIRRQLPVWLRGPWTEKLTTTIGGMLDAQLEAAKAAVRASMLTECGPDVVPWHARARLITQIPGETIEALRRRALDAWTFWSTLHRRRTVDAPSGLEALLRTHLGIPGIMVYDQANDGWLNGAQVPDGDDDHTEDASRQVIIIPQPHPWVEPEVGEDLEVGEETIVGITMTVSELSRMRALYRDHRPAHMVGIDFWIVFDSTPAEDLLNFHDATDQVIRFPVQCSMVGYEGGGAVHHMEVGDFMIVGEEFT